MSSHDLDRICNNAERCGVDKWRYCLKVISSMAAMTRRCTSCFAWRMTDDVWAADFLKGTPLNALVAGAFVSAVAAAEDALDGSTGELDVEMAETGLFDEEPVELS